MHGVIGIINKWPIIILVLELAPDEIDFPSAVGRVQGLKGQVAGLNNPMLSDL